MNRSDDDSWDITESVGATALGVALARARESGSKQPLFVDPHARQFIDAAVERGWQAPSDDDAAGLSGLFDYAACRTKWFDEFFIAAGASGVEQAVILAAGLDARAWRLPWTTRSVVYELDQPLALAFKSEVLGRHGVEPAARYVPVPIDLREDWPRALQENGFDPDVPTAWSAEGLLPYLPAAAQDLLFERLDGLSAPGSRVAVEAFGADFFDPDYLAERDVEGADVVQLWYLEDRTDVAEWLTGHGWQTSAISAADLAARYRREATHATPRSVFVAAQSSS